MTADLLATIHSATTLNQYETAFNKLKAYMSSRGYTAMTKSKLLNFFQHLFNSGLQHSTLRVHRTAISDICRLAWSIDLYDKEFKGLFFAFQNRRPAPKTPPPTWDLEKVLSFLRTGDYAKGANPTVEQALMKAIFLCTLACGQRVAELTALRRDNQHMESTPMLIIFHPLGSNLTDY